MTSTFVQLTPQDESIYLGIWTNWSQGSIRGLTFTTTLQDGGLLIAFLALYITFTGSCFWTIVSFTIHQISSKQGPQNAIYHQRQAILRNSDTSAAALWRLLRMTWSWRKRTPTATTRYSLLPLAFCLTTFSAFAIAGVFSSRVATSRGGEVLVSGDKCATLNSSLFTNENFGITQTYLASRVKSSVNYASSCYTTSSSTDRCRTFVKSTLPLTVTRKIPCPFPGKDRICRSSEGAIRVDSGFLSSHFDLGINSPPSRRFLYRTVNECAPLRSEGYTHNSTSGLRKTIQFWYGDELNYCKKHRDGCTYELLNAERETEFDARNEYSLSLTTRYNIPDDNYTSLVNTWKPISELLVPGADVSVILLQTHDIAFFTPVSDPWFEATQGPVNRSTPSGRIQVYFSDQPARALACVQQYQFCNPSLEQNVSCTPLLGIFEAATVASTTLFSQPKERNTFLWSASAITQMASGFSELAVVMNGAALLASDSLSTYGQYALPSNQWELEVEHWFKFTLADLQRAILDQATGPTVPEASQVHTPPDTAEGRAVCSNQKIRSDSYTSFNVLGLVLIFSIGGLIMLISAFLPCATERMRRGNKPFASLEWITNDTLQLQRLAHEAVGAGDWEGACDDYPRTPKGDLLAVLDTTNTKHPVLRAAQEVGLMKEEEGSMEEGVHESAQVSLLSVKIPRISLELSQRFMPDMC